MFLVHINTYKRVDKVNALIKSLIKFNQYGMHLVVFLDGRMEDDQYIDDRVRTIICQHHGKEHYYSLVNYNFHEARKVLQHGDYYVHLDDDMLINPNFFNNIIEAMKHFDIVNLHRDKRESMWGFDPGRKVIDGKYRISNWTDMNFCCRLDVLEKMPFLQPNNNAAVRSSGAARQITKWLNYEHRVVIGQFLESQVTHNDDGVSMLNPDRPDSEREEFKIK